MRVLYVINGFNAGGAEHGLLTLLQNDFFGGNELAILGLCRGRASLADDLRDTVGADHFRISDPSPTLSLNSMIKGIGTLIGEIRRRRPDAVVLSLKQANIIGRAVLMAFPGIRCIAFEHIVTYQARRLQWAYRFLLWPLSIRVGEVWADCQQTLDETSKYFVPRPGRRKHVVPLFRVADDTPEKDDYGLGDSLSICAAGRLSPVKNFDKIIRAVALLRDRGIDARLSIFGDGIERDALARLVETLDLDGRVVLKGYEAAWFTAGPDYDMYVNASDSEGFCIVVAEAMSVGLPVISTDVGGIREYGIDRENMLKAGSPAPSELADLMSELAADENLRHLLGQRAAQDMRSEYSAASIQQAGREIFAA